MDRVVLTAEQPCFRAVILPPAFDGAPLCFYIWGPHVLQQELLHAVGRKILVPQRILGSVPTWEQARFAVRATVVPFFFRDGEGYRAELPRFPDLPKECPFNGSGTGWEVLSDARGSELAVRRAPLMRPEAAPLYHPYSYLCVGRNDPTRGFYANHAVSPDRPDDFFKGLDLWQLVPRLERIEAAHPDGFMLPSN